MKTIQFQKENRVWGHKSDMISYFGGERLKIEILKATKPLSIHVHPLDYDEIYHFETDGELYLGFNIDSFFPEFIDMCRGYENPAKHLNKIIAKKGDNFYIKGGVVHGLIKGKVIEIISPNFQCKRCDICHSCQTYRLYDWERNRRLDIEKAYKILDNFRSI